MKKLKKISVLVLAAAMTAGAGMTAFAGQWEQVGDNWKYKNDDGTYLTRTWAWIDDDNDGVSECYYFNPSGYLLRNTKSPDAYTVNENGEWVVDGVVQTKRAGEETAVSTEVQHSEGFDPAHPLAGKIDQWDLRLPYPYVTLHYVCNENVQALLTNQMDSYFIPPAGESISPNGTHLYISEEDYEENVEHTQALYNWFCQWLNSIDFENMSEMDRAREIQKVLDNTGYDLYNEGGEGQREYSILIKGYGTDSDYAITAMSLAKALGLKAETTAYNIEEGSRYYIQVDGEVYYGQNRRLYLGTPIKNHPYFIN